MAVAAPSSITASADAAERVVGRWPTRQAGLVLLVVGQLAWLAGQPHLHGSVRWAPIAVVVVAHLRLVVLERRDPRLDPRRVFGAIAVVAVGAALLAPFGSRDFSIYAMYGRMVAFHHLNPYTHTPAATADPFLAQVAPSWHDDQTLYGPAFTAMSALGAIGFGSSPLLARLFFQGLAASSLVLAARVLLRRGMSSSVLILIGLSPVLVATVNGAHNDLVVGALALLGIDHATRGRTTSAAALLALASLVKISALPVAGAAFIALALTRHWQVLARSSVVFLAVFGSGYAIAGGPAAFEPLASVGTRASRASLWHALRTLEVGPQAAGSTGVVAVLLGLGAVVIVARSARGLPWPQARSLAGLATAFGVLFCFSSAYVLPWYPAAYLPLSALCLDSVPRRALAIGSLALLVAYVQPPGWPASGLAYALEAGVAAGVILGLAAVSVVIFSGSRAGTGARRWEGPATLDR